MCGIFACFSNEPEISEVFLERLKKQLKRRGPDVQLKRDFRWEEGVVATFYSCVLWLQGPRPQDQPLEDDDGNVLLWNGDVFRKDIGRLESDTKWLSDELGKASSDQEIVHILASVKGPRAFIYYRKRQGAVFYGKDFFGRHSLLKTEGQNYLVLTSVAQPGTNDFEEVAALGVYKVDLAGLASSKNRIYHLFPWNREISSKSKPTDVPSNVILSPHLLDVLSYPQLNDDLSTSRLHLEDETCDTFKTLLADPEFALIVEGLTERLKASVKMRVGHQPGLCKDCVQKHLNNDLDSEKCDHPKVGILFSGGLDSAVIAALARLVLPLEEKIDLINVAFQQENGYDVPDRITGKIAFEEMQSSDNFVEVNVTKQELADERSRRVKSLLYPLQTVLDDSIGCAIWFAARGRGIIFQDGTCQEYQSPCRVLLLGMGADEQLGGYSRHRARFKSDGMEGLLDEIRLEMSRISERNLGRDNRIVSDHGVAGRYPFLDEDVVSYLNSLRISDKMNLNLERGIGEKLLLRAVAYKLGLHKTAFNPKRAIQFGSRIAKLENRKEKASDVAMR